MSATGSVIMVVRSESPARFHDARHLAAQRPLAEADPAHCKAAHVGARPATQAAAVVLLHLELRRAQRLRDHRLLRHESSPLPSLLALIREGVYALLRKHTGFSGRSGATLPRAGRACPTAPAGAALPRRC